MTKQVENILTIIALLTAFSGGYFYIDRTYAREQEVRQLENRIDYKIAKDALHDIQDRLWKLEDRYLKKVMPDTTKEEYRKLQEDKKEIEEELKTYKAK